MCPLPMPFEGIGVKEHNGVEGTWQLHAQMGAAHMSTDGGTGEWGSFKVPLNPAVIDLVGIPYVATKGHHLSGYVAPLGLGDR